MAQLAAHRAALLRQRGRAHAVVCRAVPRDGVRAVDLAREPSRHRSEPVGQCEEALCDGLSIGGQALDAGRRKRIAPLAYLVRSDGRADPSCAQARCERVAQWRVGQHRVRAGLQHHRSVSEPVRLGAVSLHQGRCQASHSAGPARRVYSYAADRTSGVICDQRVMLNGFYSAKNYPEHLRRIRFKDPESGKTLVFLTNNTSLPALTIAALYKSRWQVELFFRWIKQHLRIKRFLGTSENAVKTQIWCAVATYVLIAIVKKELQLDASLYTCLQILSVSVFEKTELSCALQPDRSQSDPPVADNQLLLFDF